MRRAAAWPVAALGLLAAAACAPTGQGGGCAAREVTLRNASTLPIEQAYGGPGAPGAWGVDLIGATDLAPGATRTLRLPAGAQAVRLVWANGRAAERPVAECAIRAITLTDTQVLAE